MSEPLHAKPDIRHYNRIDNRWMTDLLRDCGLDVVVDHVEKRPVGTGQIADSIRFEISYRHGDASAPSTLVGKFPSDRAASRAHALRRRNYLREVKFYQMLAPSARVKTPRIWFAAIDETTHDFVLMMEDLAPAIQGDQLSGVTLEQARCAIVEAAKLHASFWQDDRLDKMDWISNSNAAPAHADDDRITRSWRGFKERYQPALKAEWMTLAERILQRIPQFLSTVEGPRCLTHYDYRPDNMMFDQSPAVTILDWQSCAVGSGAIDVAYFLAGSLDAATRRDAELDLLHLYHATLTNEGVKNYDFDLLKRHYGQGALLLLATAVVASMSVARTPRGDEMFLKMFEGASIHLLDHGH